jgi:Flp pilus assembly protein protease CpaA
MTNLLSALQAPMAFYAMDNVQATAAVLAAVLTVVLLLKRRSRQQKTQNAARR